MFYIIKMFSVRTELQISDDFILETTFSPFYGSLGRDPSGLQFRKICALGGLGWDFTTFIE